MSIRRGLLAVLVVAFGADYSSAQSDFVAPGAAESFTGALASSVASISAPALASHIGFLASPSLGGRGLGGASLESAGEYIAAELKRANIAPYGRGDSDFFQAVPLRQVTATSGELQVERRESARVARRTFSSGVDCVFRAAPSQSLDAVVVFAGYGIKEETPLRDDYAGLDVRGKIVLIIGGVPAGAEWQKNELLSRYAPEDYGKRHNAKLEIAQKLGAAALLVIEDDALATNMAANLYEEERGFRPFDSADEMPLLIRVSQSVARSILGGDPAKIAKNGPTGATAGIRITATEKLIGSRNVIAIIPGSDERLRGDAVVIGAHFDHLGKSGDSTFFGADDNASGTAALLEIAKTFAASPEKPKRTVIFAFWTGEEEGYLGSLYYVTHPRWPLASTAAYLNLDMIAHPWLMDEIRKLVTDNKLPDADQFLAAVKPADFVEPGVPKGFPALETAVRNSAKGNGFAMHIDWTDGKNGGSDYRYFARNGVPFVRFFGNFHRDYHKPGDTYESIDPAQVQRVARFAFATAWQLANP